MHAYFGVKYVNSYLFMCDFADGQVQCENSKQPVYNGFHSTHFD